MEKNVIGLSSRITVLFLVVVHLLFAVPAVAAVDDLLDDDLENDEFVLDVPHEKIIADPLESLNRVFFVFNDRMYFWVLKPVATGYKAVLADDDVRMCISNAFHNILAPIRVVNNLLQGKIAGAGNEMASFLINSTFGVAGLADPAHKEFGLTESDEDFGQTLGYYGLGNGFYICWPVLGPSTLRDSVGRLGDFALDPLVYLTDSDEILGYGLQVEKQVNRASLSIGEYEQFKAASFDPYVAVRNAYVQHRQSRVADEVGTSGIDYGAGIDKNEVTASSVVEVIEVEAVPEQITVASADTAGATGTVPEAFQDVVGEGFYVLVGVFRDSANIELQKKRLSAIGKKVVVARYSRENYAFYGVEVPGGEDFSSAKMLENELQLAGFNETSVVRH